MNNFFRRRALPAAALLTLAVPLPAAAQTQDQCQTLRLGIGAGADAASASINQANVLARQRTKMAVLTLILSQDPKMVDSGVVAKFEEVSDQLGSAIESLTKGQSDIVARIAAATDAWAALCRR
ncbi:hypothetical protein KXS07_26855 [Inquilinus limosus]|uniref:hypothetical protein n=1 Tax=Inquilinus limosus TaxID=171674 RepID=UPI003F14DB5D